MGSQHLDLAIGGLVEEETREGLQGGRQAENLPVLKIPDV